MTRQPSDTPVAQRTLIVVATWIVMVGATYMVEQTRGFTGTRLVESCLVLVALAVTTWAVPGKVRDALVVICSLVFGFIVLEGAIKVMGAFSKTSSQRAVSHDDGLGGVRPFLGWGPPKAGVFHAYKTDGNGKLIYDTHVTIDAALNRKTVPSEGPRPIVFFGDSWIFGDGVEDDGTLPQAFANLEQGRIPVLNLGFNGWSPAVNLVALQNGIYKPILQDPRHFILFTATFHLERTACKYDYATTQAPRFILANGEVKYTGSCAQAEAGLLAPVIRFLRKFELYNRFAPKLAAPGRKDVETYIKIIETFVTAAQRMYNVKTTVLFAPFRDEYIKDSGYTEKEIIDTLRKAGVDVLIDKLPPIADDDLYWIPGDGHPTALANKARAREIQAHLREVDPDALKVAADPLH